MVGIAVISTLYDSHISSLGPQVVCRNWEEIKDLISRFLWKGSEPGQSQGLSTTYAVLSMICRPTNSRGLVVLDAHSMNMVLLTKWVARLKSQRAYGKIREGYVSRINESFRHVGSFGNKLFHLRCRYAYGFSLE